MTSRRRIAIALLAGGALVWAVGLLADPLGVGGVSGFNWKQVVAAEAGALAVFAGVLLLVLRPQGERQE